MPIILAVLKVARSHRAPSRTVPTGLHTLSLAWLGQYFEALVVQKGSAAGGWIAPEPVTDLESFAAAVKEAKVRTGYTGTQVNLVFAHARLGQQLCDAPPAKGAALDRIVARLIDRQKTFDGEAAWGYQATLPTKTSPSILLFLFPKVLVDQMVKACAKSGLNLNVLVPCTAVLGGLLSDTMLPADEVTLLAAEAGGMTAVLAARADGQILLGRLLEASWRDNPNNLAVELNRTILFVNQQFGTSVRSAFLSGPAAEECQPTIQASLQVPVKSAPEEAQAFSWALELARTPLESCPNLISAEQRRAPQRLALTHVTKVVTAILVLASIAVTIRFATLTREERRAIEKLQTQVSQLQLQHQALQRLHAELGRQRELVRLIADEQLAPVPLWFLSYLGQLVPPELAVTNFSVLKEDSGWRFRLSGLLQPGNSSGLAGPLSALTNQLGSGPFGASFVKVADEVTPESTPSLGTGIRNLALRGKPAAGESKPAARQYHVEGVLP